MVLLICKWAEVLARFLNAGANCQCLVDVWHFWPYYGWMWIGCLLIHSMRLEMLRYLMVMDSLLIFPIHVKCAYLVYPLPLVRPVKFTVRKFFFSSGGMKMRVPSSGSTQAGGSGKGTSRVSTCLVITTCKFSLKQITPSLVSVYKFLDTLALYYNRQWFGDRLCL